MSLQNTRITSLDSGTKQATITLHDQFYFDKGFLKPINLSIEPCNLWEFEYYCYKNNFTAYFNDATDIINFNLASFEIKNSYGVSRWINYKLVGASPARVEVNGNRIKYIEAYPGIDVEYVVTEKRLKELIHVQDRQSYRDVEFSIKLEGCSYHRDAQGNIIFIDDVTGEQIYMITAPFAFEANNERNRGGAEYVFSQTVVDGKIYESIKVVVDQTWLYSTTYPIIVDPTVTINTDASSKDAIVAGGAAADINYRDHIRLEVGISSGVVRRGFIQPDMSIIPPSATISSVIMYLWCASLVVAANVNVHDVIAAWEENTITWNNQPSFNAPIIASATPVRNQWAAFNITFNATNWIKGVSVNNGLVIKTPNDDGYILFFSSDEASNRPYFVVTYTEPVTGSNIKANIGGTYKDCTAQYVHIGGAWKQVAGRWVNVNGIWKQV